MLPNNTQTPIHAKARYPIPIVAIGPASCLCIPGTVSTSNGKQDTNTKTSDNRPKTTATSAVPVSRGLTYESRLVVIPSRSIANFPSRRTKSTFAGTGTSECIAVRAKEVVARRVSIRLNVLPNARGTSEDAGWRRTPFEGGDVRVIAGGDLAVPLRAPEAETRCAGRSQSRGVSVAVSVYAFNQTQCLAANPPNRDGRLWTTYGTSMRTRPSNGPSLFKSYENAATPRRITVRR
jgi:hypothetical protein